MRLFVAITLDEQIKDEILRVQDELWHNVLQGRRTGRDNLHLTLAFLGEMPSKALGEIRRAMERSIVWIEPFMLKFGDLGRFRRPGGDLWWLGVEKSPSLMTLAGQVQDQLRCAGFPLENRSYAPHLTLGRQMVLRPGARPVPEVSPQAVTRIQLMNSSRVRGVLTYTSVAETLL
jgi:2'-5' RNA ligase